jgi:hypothetical protein
MHAPPAHWSALLAVGRGFAGDVVLDLVEPVTDGKFGSVFAIGKPVALEASAELQLTRPPGLGLKFAGTDIISPHVVHKGEAIPH